MKRFLSTLFVIAVVVSLVTAPGMAIAQAKAAPKCEDPIGVVTIKPGEPIHIAAWMVVAGPDASLGTDASFAEPGIDALTGANVSLATDVGPIAKAGIDAFT